MLHLIIRESACSGTLTNTKPEFDTLPQLLIAQSGCVDIIAEELPRFLILRDLEYILIGYTMFLKDHFVLNLFDGKEFKIYNNIDVKNTKVIDKLDWIIKAVFYRLLD
jgi:hypothetical protein